MSDGTQVEARLGQRHYLLLLLGEFLDELNARCETDDDSKDAVLVALIRDGLQPVLAQLPELRQEPTAAELCECLEQISSRAESGRITAEDPRRLEQVFSAFRRLEPR